MLALVVAAALAAGAGLATGPSAQPPAHGAPAAGGTRPAVGEAATGDHGRRGTSGHHGRAWPPFALPVTDALVLRLFAAPTVRWGPGHRGVDLAAAPGTPVVAPADGAVTFAGPVVDRGVLTISHPGGLRTSVEPVSTGLVVGTVVARGQVVATVSDAAGHCRPRSCLHWGVRRGADYVDPLSLLGPVLTVLLPVPAGG